MAFQKVIVIMSGGGDTGLIKLSGSFDGLNDVRCECKCGNPRKGSKLYVFADEITELTFDGDKTTFEVPISAKSDIACLLYDGGKTLIGSSGGRADRRQLEGRLDAMRRKKAREAALKRESEERIAREKETRAEEARRLAEEARRLAEERAESSRALRRDETGGEKRRENEHINTRRPVHADDVPNRETDVRGASACRNEANSFPYEAQITDDSYARAVLRNGVTYDGTNFFRAVKPQLDEMFVRYPAESRLNAIVPNSKWVRVDLEDGDYYVLGLLFDLSEPTFICYGIPGTGTTPPPSEISDVCVWLPLDNSLPQGAGFWVIYQSATNGKCIK